MNNNEVKITCPKCQSEKVNIQIVNEAKLVKKHHSIIWWLLIGWWWIFVKWLVFTIPALIFKIFGIGKRKKIKNISHKEYVCQNCGYSWRL